MALARERNVHFQLLVVFVVSYRPRTPDKRLFLIRLIFFHPVTYGDVVVVMCSVNLFRPSRATLLVVQLFDEGVESNCGCERAEAS